MSKHSKSPRRYSERTLKILWGRAAGRCAVPECRLELFKEATEHDPIVVIGDIAHIEAAMTEGRVQTANCRPKRETITTTSFSCVRTATSGTTARNTRTRLPP